MPSSRRLQNLSSRTKNQAWALYNIVIYYYRKRALRLNHLVHDGGVVFGAVGRMGLLGAPKSRSNSVSSSIQI